MKTDEEPNEPQTAATPEAEPTPALPENEPGECPPPIADGDAERDMALLRAIAAHPKAAQFLAELADGGDESELLQKHFPRQPAMYQPVQNPALRPCNNFLSHVSGSFWD